MTRSLSVANSVSETCRFAEKALVVLMIGFSYSLPALAQSQAAASSADASPKVLSSEGLQQRVGELEGEVAELKRIVKELQSNSKAAGRDRKSVV